MKLQRTWATRMRRVVALTAACLTPTMAIPTAHAQRPRLRLERFAEGFSLALAFVQDPSDPAVQYVCEQRGRIHVLVDGVVQSELFLDLTGVASREGGSGLLGLAFPPDYATDGRLYVYLNRDNGNPAPDPIQLLRYERDPQNPLRALIDSEEIVLEIPREVNGHSGGNIAFGPDGMLYLGVGDGRLDTDPDTGPQDPDSMFGKFLRIDVSPESGYVVPPDNPFLDGQPIAALPEIWSFGWRNPWRWSFDDPALGGTGALVIGDVGLDDSEEVDYEPAGAGARNYGWPNREGSLPHGNFPPPAYEPLTDPIYEYALEGQSITGGYVYRGQALGPAFQGRYFFADFVHGRVWSAGLDIDPNGEASVTDVFEHTDELGGPLEVGPVTSFGVDREGELYLVSLEPGAVKRISAAFSLRFDGECPGAMRFIATGATANERVAFVYAMNTGSCTIPNGRPCAGTVLDLTCATAAVGGTDVANANGRAVLDANVPARGCDRVYVQAVDLASCATSIVVEP